jgi:hypothetical protein
LDGGPGSIRALGVKALRKPRWATLEIRNPLLRTKSVRQTCNALKEYVTKLRAKFKKNPAWLDPALPAKPFRSSHAARFAFVHLMRDLIRDSGCQIKKGDAMDLGHAVIASAFSNFATLDKQWKRRVESLPKPNQNPRVYYEPELEITVADMEAALGSR